ncbi:MAG: hypothetical protein ACPH56_03665 [Spongiibacter marinus]|jgi:hypothetical protein|uniref:hypothetical protein n=1 Tax=Spongiibacter marinus TaxID=354246 RepID=UPI003C4A757C
MKLSSAYKVLAVTFCAAMLAAWLIPLAEWVRGMIALPGVGALVGVLVLVARDVIRFEREKHLQLDQQIFTLGAGSHMSTVAFDKHVEFCEAYMSEVHDTVGVLFREGPTETATECAHKLFALKRQFAAWIPKAMALKLEPFEDALNRIGAMTHLVEALGNTQPDTRSKALDESYAIFMNVMSLGKLKETDPDHKKELAVENVKEEIRNILGVNELSEIRRFIIERSVEFARRGT